ncbi:hypothetical protein EMCG_07935 [[Emmonsia] crescens]|uniref:Uncharacterized protein n=1 Tax=[Emmonsia] crescens TaxID=73230 RepID=A0A0G2J514_9EURO|nr:hypothetical protein EMCG_07935 [Emmonsia crescens UAMH 3008]
MADSRRRRRAVDSLERLPAAKYGLNARRLQDLCSNGRFSASTVPTEAFLTVRCIWPAVLSSKKAADYIVTTNSFYTEEHVSKARELICKEALGLHKLNTLFDIICSDPMKTPPQWVCTVGDGLGPFSMLVSLKSQIMAKPLHTFEKGESYPVTFAPKKQAHNAFQQPLSGEDPDSPTPKRPRLQSPGAMDEDQADTSEPELKTDTEVELAETITDQIPDDIPEPRTPTETLIVDFMVNLLGGIACLIQPLAPHIVCVANAFETTYCFGPVRNTTGTNNDDIQFRARIDGSIPFSLPHNNVSEAVIFKAKRTDRPNGKGGAAVMGQQSMEHVASSGVYHTFMIAQDYLSFHISIGTYDNQYLDYIFGVGDALVVPQNGEEPSFLRIQEFGPFDVDERDDMKLLCEIVLSWLICQLEQIDKGEMIKEALL